MYKLADDHLTTLTESLHQVIGDACKTYVEDAIIRFKQEVYSLFDPADSDDINGAYCYSTRGEWKMCVNYGVWNERPPGSATVNVTHNGTRIEMILQKDETLVIGKSTCMEVPITQPGGKCRVHARLFITSLGNLYFQTGDEYGGCHGSMNIAPTIVLQSSLHVTNTPLSPLFESILINAAACLGVNSRVEGFKNLLDMNRKYYYLLAKDAGGEIVRRERELAQNAAANGERAAEFESKYNAEYEKRRTAEAELAALKEKVRAVVG